MSEVLVTGLQKIYLGERLFSLTREIEQNRPFSSPVVTVVFWRKLW